MIQQATYGDGARTATIRLERIDTWVEDTESIVNFPGLVELEGDQLYMTYHRGRPGGVEPLASVVSDDAGRTWREAPADSPFIERHPVTGQNYVDFGSGILGYLADGTIVRIDTNAIEAEHRTYEHSQGAYHFVMRSDSATFRLRRWAGNGELIESFAFKVEGMPWATGAYENYSTILEFANGDLITALSAWPDPDAQIDSYPVRKWSMAVIRSSDRGRTWRCMTAPPVGGQASVRCGRPAGHRGSTNPTSSFCPTAPFSA